jgi:branched-chain amino acid transport system ATP-binding protein
VQAAHSNGPLLQVEGLTKFFGGLAAVRDVTFDVHEREIFGIIGPNGAGKTTMFGLIAGAHPPTSGTIRYRGKDVTGLKPFELVKTGIARTHQIVRPFREMTVLENVEVAASYGRIKLPNMAAVRKRALQILDSVGLGALANSSSSILSVGNQKRLEIARALATGPELFLCDEICGGLTHAETAAMLALLRSIRDKGTTIMYVEHDVKAIASICDRILVLNYGRKLSEGTPDHIQSDPAVIEAYLGHAPSNGGAPHA